MKTDQPSQQTPPSPTTNTTSSTSLGRVRGFTVDLVFLLGEGQKRCCDLMEVTGQSYSYVWRYLRNMEKYGLTEKSDVFWRLTDAGREFLVYLNIVYGNNNNNNRKIIERKKKEERKKIETKPKQVKISAWLNSSKRDDLENRVVEVLVEHYNKTEGSLFLYFADYYEAAEFFKCTPDEIVETMRKLKQDKIAYPWRDPSLNAWKIGLYKAWVEQFKMEEKTI